MIAIFGKNVKKAGGLRPRKCSSGGRLFVPCGKYRLQLFVGSGIRFVFERREPEDHVMKPPEIDAQRILAREPLCKFPGKAVHVTPRECQGSAPFQRAYFL